MSGVAYSHLTLLSMGSDIFSVTVHLLGDLVGIQVNSIMSNELSQHLLVSPVFIRGILSFFPSNEQNNSKWNAASHMGHVPCGIILFVYVPYVGHQVYQYSLVPIILLGTMLLKIFA